MDYSKLLQLIVEASCDADGRPWSTLKGAERDYYVIRATIIADRLMTADMIACSEDAIAPAPIAIPIAIMAEAVAA